MSPDAPPSGPPEEREKLERLFALSQKDVLAGEPPELASRIEQERLVVLEDLGEGAESFVVAYVIFERSRQDVLHRLQQAEKLDPEFDSDLAKMEGFWELSPYVSSPNRTLARFGSNVDVGPAVPRFVQKGLSRRTVLRYLRNCQQWIDSNGTWPP